MSNVTVDPPAATYTQEGGTSTHQINNPGPDKVAIKVKCSDNNLFKVSSLINSPNQLMGYEIFKKPRLIIRRRGPANDLGPEIAGPIFVPADETTIELLLAVRGDRLRKQRTVDVRGNCIGSSWYTKQVQADFIDHLTVTLMGVGHFPLLENTPGPYRIGFWTYLCNELGEKKTLEGFIGLPILHEVVYAFVDAGAPIPLKIQRSPGPPKEDRLVVQHQPAGAAADPKECFPPGGTYPEVGVILSCA